MNKKMNPKTIAVSFLQELAALGEKKKCKIEKVEKLKIACDATRFLRQGENLWRENKFAEADVKFREGKAFIEENLHKLDKRKDSVEYSVIELLSYDFKFLPEAVLFDREFQSISQAKNFKELKIRIRFIMELAKKNMSKEIPYYPPLRAIFAIKMRYFCLLTEAMLGESFKDNIKDKSDIKKSFHTFQRINFKMAKESLEAIDDFLIALKDAVRKHGGLVFIPPQEELNLMKILQRGFSQEKPKLEKKEPEAEKWDYARIWTSQTKAECENINEKQYSTLISDKKHYDVIVVISNRTEVYVGENLLDESLKPIHLSILKEVFKNKGNAGNALNLLDKTFESHGKVQDLTDALRKAVRTRDSIRITDARDAIYKATGKVRTEITRLNDFMNEKMQLKVKLKTGRRGDYKFTPSLNYLYIELADSSYKYPSS